MYTLPSCYLHEMITSMNVNVLSSSQAYSKAVGGPVLRNHSHPMTSITTHLLPNETNSKTPSQRYKTELCRSYHETGFCKYGEKCQFAHGYDEIRSLNRHPKYKTVLCRTYHCTGYCPYGPRCHFLHDECSETLSCKSLSPSSSFGSDIRSSSISSSRSISPMDSPLISTSTSTDDVFLSAYFLSK